jgi:hypothetical protein
VTASSAPIVSLAALDRRTLRRKEPMARVFITGSADGLGRAAALNLLDDGHEVGVHARSNVRLAAVRTSSTSGPQPWSGTYQIRTTREASPSR